jgi:hypothetical protein
MKLAIVQYSTGNLGDDIQSLALERLLPHVDLRIDRDDITPARDWDDDVRWIINGWYTPGRHHGWPPQTKAKCLFVGFHATGSGVLPERSELPFGCRDPWTLRLCAQKGIEAWLSWCVTLTWERPPVAVTDDVILVDVPIQIIDQLPPEIARGRQITHSLPPNCDRRQEALDRLKLYAQAKWVVTTRLHVLLPCAAMGTPVVFIRPPNYHNRYGGYTHLAWRIGTAPWGNPQPRIAPEIVRSLTVPLRDAIKRFTKP